MYKKGVCTLLRSFDVRFSRGSVGQSGQSIGSVIPIDQLNKEKKVRKKIGAVNSQSISQTSEEEAKKHQIHFPGNEIRYKRAQPRPSNYKLLRYMYSIVTNHSS